MNTPSPGEYVVIGPRRRPWWVRLWRAAFRRPVPLSYVARVVGVDCATGVLIVETEAEAEKARAWN